MRMNRSAKSKYAILLALVFACGGCPTFAASVAAKVGSEAVKIKTITYHGWTGSYLLSNRLVEVVVVPAVGRVMQFRLVGDEVGTLWENRSMDGLKVDPTSKDWQNIGGDKCWPAPQSDWPKIAGRGWPPPMAFDNMPATAEVHGEELVMTSQVDPGYGIRVVRRISLARGRPEMTITTTYRKVSGKPLRVAIWTITQTQDPRRVFVLLPEKPKFAGGVNLMGGPLPYEFKIAGRLLSLRRHPTKDLKIGTEGDKLLWIGERAILRIESERTEGEYPNGGDVTEVYTNAGATAYVELEFNGPLSTLRQGEKMEQTMHYKLSPRTTSDETEEAKKAFKL